MKVRCINFLSNNFYFSFKCFLKNHTISNIEQEKGVAVETWFLQRCFGFRSLHYVVTRVIISELSFFRYFETVKLTFEIAISFKDFS